MESYVSSLEVYKSFISEDLIPASILESSWTSVKVFLELNVIGDGSRSASMMLSSLYSHCNGKKPSKHLSGVDD